jgi:hypothetical protein
MFWARAERSRMVSALAVVGLVIVAVAAAMV